MLAHLSGFELFFSIKLNFYLKASGKDVTMKSEYLSDVIVILLHFSDPQALNDFLHGTAEVTKKKVFCCDVIAAIFCSKTFPLFPSQLRAEDLLISASSGEASLFADAPVSVKSLVLLATS